MIYEFIYNKDHINLKKHFPVDFDELDNKDQINYIKLQKINEQKNRKKKGVLAANLIVINDVPTVCIGWSLCNFGTKKKPKDKFNDVRGRQIAYNRAEVYSLNQYLVLNNIPHSIKKQLKRFIERSRKYFHVDDKKVVFSPWINTFINTSTITKNNV